MSPLSIICYVIRQSCKLYFLNGPSKPIHQIAIEASIELLNREKLLPCTVKIAESAKAGVFLTQAMKGKMLQKINMCPMWLLSADIANQ